jgi:hypothetical protein
MERLDIVMGPPSEPGLSQEEEEDIFKPMFLGGRAAVPPEEGGGKGRKTGRRFGEGVVVLRLSKSSEQDLESPCGWEGKTRQTLFSIFSNTFEGFYMCDSPWMDVHRVKGRGCCRSPP